MQAITCVPHIVSRPNETNKQTSWRVSHSLCDGNVVGHLRFECSPRKVALCVVVERDLGEQVRAGDGDKKTPLGLSLLQQRDGVALLGESVEEE
jgi:hypothetical protein